MGKINITKYNIIIDLRSQKAFESDKKLYEALGIEAINMDFFDAPKKVEMLDKNKSYLLVCDSGTFSNIIQKIMVSKGFKKVENLEQGITQLREIIRSISKP